jgi:hypothetical protein
MSSFRALSVARYAIAWLAGAAAAGTVLALVMGPAGVLLALGGPISLLAYKPGQGMLGKLALALVLSLPAIAGATILIRRRARIGRAVMLLSVVALSLWWHGMGTVILLVILSSLN